MPRGSRPLSDGEPVDVGATADPVAALLDAHAAGRLVALRTSGSTGSPRAVVRTPESWVRSFGQVAELTRLGPGSTLWLPGPLSATMNLFAAALARWIGADQVDHPERATHTHLTPLVLARALDDAVPLDGVHVTVAGDRLTRSLRQRAERAGAAVTHYYGAAELSFVAWGADEEDLRPFPGVDVDVRHDEIWVRSPFVCEGYADAAGSAGSAGAVGPAGPLRRDGHGWATVGDRGALTGDTLQVAGRGDDAVTTGAATVLVADVEHALRPAVEGTVAVVGVPHGTLGEVVAAVLTRRTDLPAAHGAAQRLAPALRPRLWFHVPALPTTGAGKVARTELVAQVTGPDAVRLVPRRPRLPAS